MTQTGNIVTAAHCWYSIDVAGLLLGGNGGGVGIVAVRQLLLLMRWMLLNMAVHGTG